MKEETKHTPSPWKVKPVYSLYDNAYGIYGEDGNVYVKEGEHIANANLIAAAPDLFACMLPKLEAAPDPLSAISALVADYQTLREQATGAMVEDVDPVATWEAINEIQGFLKEARAAIQKAKGETI